MDASRARYGVVVRGDRHGPPHMLLASMGTHDVGKVPYPLWAALVMLPRDDEVWMRVTEITLGPQNVWEEQQ